MRKKLKEKLWQENMWNIFRKKTSNTFKISHVEYYAVFL